MAISFEHLAFGDPSPLGRDLLWHVLSIGVVTRDEPERHQGFDKPGAFLFWVKAGCGDLELEPGTVRLEVGTKCWLLDLRKARTYVPLGDGPLSTIGIRFGGPGLETWLERLGTDSEFVICRTQDLAELRKIHGLLSDLARCRPSGYEWQSHTLITQALGILLRTRGLLGEPAAEPSGPVTQVLRDVLADPTRDWKARELAKVAGVSYSKLRVLFRQSQHETIHGFLQRTRLDQARLLLGDSRLSIKDVSRRLNFSSEFYFSHFFRKATGTSPTNFRKGATS